MFGDDGYLTHYDDGMPYKVRVEYVKSLKATKESKKYRAVCPWCLYIGTLADFMQINTRTGHTHKDFICPECGTHMRKPTTAIFDKGVEEYARWFWMQIYDFRAKERFMWNKVRDRLRVLGAANEFWRVHREEKKKRGKM